MVEAQVTQLLAEDEMTLKNFSTSIGRSYSSVLWRLNSMKDDLLKDSKVRMLKIGNGRTQYIMTKAAREEIVNAFEAPRKKKSARGEATGDVPVDNERLKEFVSIADLSATSQYPAQYLSAFAQSHYDLLFKKKLIYRLSNRNHPYMIHPTALQYYKPHKKTKMAVDIASSATPIDADAKTVAPVSIRLPIKEGSTFARALQHVVNTLIKFEHQIVINDRSIELEAQKATMGQLHNQMQNERGYMAEILEQNSKMEKRLAILEQSLGYTQAVVAITADQRASLQKLVVLLFHKTKISFDILWTNLHTYINKPDVRQYTNEDYEKASAYLEKELSKPR